MQESKHNNLYSPRHRMEILYIGYLVGKFTIRLLIAPHLNDHQIFLVVRFLKVEKAELANCAFRILCLR